ncbi:hypothetical protein [Polyangium aurulentum]|uniref:hypothetical protein n=1 Tax=Polyangium aurulentum TaxID=2567896 RepID=UPI0010ADC484|nr:hypothetical protein [Polyangium aurulentum]UQA58166.1 hypothetical protein E8A73_044090 [Polyangium aurulentum]
MPFPSDVIRHLAASKRALSSPAATLDDAVRHCDLFTTLDPREDVNAGDDPHPSIIEVRRRERAGGGDLPEGIATMAARLRKRVRFDLLFEEGDAAAERIAKLSGGCIRHALQIVRDAVNEQDTPPVTAASVDRAAAGMQAAFARALPETYVPVLEHVAKTNRFPDDCKEEVKRALLQHLFVLEYQSGAAEPWWAVHPLVERCRKYRERP